ncbi:Inositol transporter 1 [Cyphellophora attinorum]|uniref:Inositol transporter 1 n=1 Tax=Cyphellophora attinorum TaxID=1664694 RepID=A0A0N1NYW8_9EURO|nr:Inositol transporter 1 [Phialophora attinorum]KPI40565.1 Inositol transporter 1 [Phialophora attinorum]
MRPDDADDEALEPLARAASHDEDIDLDLPTRSPSGPLPTPDDLAAFIKTNNLQYKRDIFHRAALLLQGDTPPTEIVGITPAELDALEDEGRRKNNLILGLINSGIYLSNGLLGAWLVAPLNKHLGRRGAVFWATVVSLLTNLGGPMTQNWQQLLFFRLVLGCALGVVSSTLNVFAAECAPAVIRGGLAVSWQAFCAFGIFVGFVANVVEYDFGPNTWRWQLVGPVLTTIPLLALICVGSGISIIIKVEEYRVTGSEGALHVTSAARREKLGEQLSYVGQLRELFTVPRIRRATIAAYSVMVCQQLCGINIISFYSSTIFADANFSTYGALMASTIFGLVNFLFAFPAVWTMDTLGRRSLLLLTLPFMAITMFLASLAFSIPEAKHPDLRLGLLASMIYLFCALYSPGMGPVPAAYAAEVFPLSHRELGMSSALLSALGSQGAFGLYAALNVVALLVVFLFVPETRLMTLEELDGVFRISTRKFIHYQCVEYLPWWTRKYVMREKGQEVPQMANDDAGYREVEQEDEFS